MQTALTIGATESSGGSGVQADLKAFTVLGVYGMAITTSVIARNTNGSLGAEDLDPRFVVRQIEAVAEDLPVGAFKTGFLGMPAMIDAVAEGIRRAGLDKYVCDPVLHSGHSGKGGAGNGDTALIHAYRKELLPLATIATPNRAEAALFANMEEGDVVNVTGAKKAAEKIVRSGARAVVIKGLQTGDRVLDLFFDGDSFVEFPAKRVTTKNTYGAGCLFSAVITGMLAQDIELATAVDHARSFVSQAIEHHVKIGHGLRAVNVLALTPQ
jgi:hydroxymethylpyrimidine kinase/phosphomethylpyrimidine kinase